MSDAHLTDDEAARLEERLRYYSDELKRGDMESCATVGETRKLLAERKALRAEVERLRESEKLSAASLRECVESMNAGLATIAKLEAQTVEQGVEIARLRESAP